MLLFLGSSVVVLQNSLWRRGIVMNEHSVFLVDVGKFVKLVSKKWVNRCVYKKKKTYLKFFPVNSVRLCPPEFLELPMYTVKCHLVNVEANKNCDPQDVVEHMSQSLKNVNLKIVAIVRTLSLLVLSLLLTRIDNFWKCRFTAKS